MTQPLEFTGERFTPECVREIWYEHIHRYAFAGPVVAGKTVLDAACGEGYGAAHLASMADSVKAVDISEQAISHARERYRADNLEFQVADCCKLPFPDNHFDCVISFETLEHLDNQSGLLREFRRVLSPDGFLIISSPDKAIYTDKHHNDNEFHVRELYRDELDDLLAAQFPARCIMNQKLMFHSVIWPEEAQPGQQTFQQSGPAGISQHEKPAQSAMYFIVLCAAHESALPRLNAGSWFFDDQEESVYQHYHHEIRKNMSAGESLQAMEEELNRLRSQVNKPSGEAAQPDSWWRRIFRGT